LEKKSPPHLQLINELDVFPERSRCSTDSEIIPPSGAMLA
jgi:hypothetical protein